MFYIYMSQGNGQNRDLNKSLRDMIKSRKMLQWRIHFIICLEKISHLIKSLNLFSEMTKLAKKPTRFYLIFLHRKNIFKTFLWWARIFVSESWMFSMYEFNGFYLLNISLSSTHNTGLIELTMGLGRFV
jgi:hypothetical protein